MRIYIPTLNRAGKQRTLNNLPPKLRKRTSLVINDSDYRANTQTYVTYAKDTGCGLLVVPPKITGIARVREYIGKDAANEGEDRFVMVDDDLWFYHRKGKDHTHLYKNTPSDTADMFNWLDELLDKYAHASISMRQANNRIEEELLENVRYVRVLAFQTKAFNSCIHGRVDVMEDFDVILQLLERGLPSAVIYHYAQDQQQTQAAGGCSTYRTQQMQEEAAKQLAKLHPGIVTLKARQNRTGGEFGKRIDVIIQWKKAYQQRKGFFK